MQIGSSVGASTTSKIDPSDQASVLVGAKALKQQKQEGNSEVELIESAGAPGNGQLVNTYA
jgi:hypothetical protein